MTRVHLTPARARGTATAPPSKSYTHRALLVGHLAHRPFRIRDPLVADDTRATARALAALGTRVQRGPHEWLLRPGPGRRRGSRRTIDCGASGTTLRFATALAALAPGTTRLTGTERLGERPMAELLDALRALGARSTSRDGGLPLAITGPMLGGRARLEASRSSQFVSALLLTLPVCPRDSVVQLSGPIVSAPYIAATRAVMARHGISLPPGDRTLRIRGRQVYRGGQFQVPGDASSAAYLWAAAAVSGGDVRVEGVPTSWPQADLAILPLLARNGAEVVRTSRGARVRAGPRRAFTVDLTDAPDLYPLAGVLAATTPGASRLRGAAHVVLKESDRRAGTARLARALGARVQFRAGGLDIRGTAQPRSFAVGDLDDHRLVMSAAVGALAADGVSTIGDAHAVAKSFPAFWTVLGSLTGRRGGP